MRCLILLGLLQVSCLRETQYQCSGASSCGAGGQCESTGYCSLPDGECSSGRRYSEAAGPLAGTCVGGSTTEDDADVQPMDDGGTTTTDAMADGGQMASCPAGYATLPNGQAGHMYRVITAPEDWDGAQAFCQATTVAATLAVPDDATELTAISTAAGSGVQYWVGVTDTVTEGTWVNVLGAAQTFLPWQAPAPDDQSPGEDCVSATDATFNDRRCTNVTLPYVCECGP